MILKSNEKIVIFLLPLKTFGYKLNNFGIIVVILCLGGYFLI